MERKYYSAFTRTHTVNYINVAPFIYRYENQEWIDNFFETGEILISCFDQYSKYEDNQLGDMSEGLGSNMAIAQDGLIFTKTKFGMDCYCFCTSTQLRKELFKTFDRNSVFRIKDSINFMMQVEIALKNVTEVLFGNCIYLEERSIKKKIESVNFDAMANGSKNISVEDTLSLAFKIGGFEQLFLKKLMHQEQNEYRLLWKTDSKVTDSILIQCPEAIKFCEKVELI